MRNVLAHKKCNMYYPQCHKLTIILSLTRYVLKSYYKYDIYLYIFFLHDV